MSVSYCYGKVTEYLKDTGLELSEPTKRRIAVALDNLQQKSLTKAEFAVKVDELVNTEVKSAAAAYRAAALLDLESSINLAHMMGEVANKEIPIKERILAATGRGGGRKAGYATNRSTQYMATTLQNNWLAYLRSAVPEELRIVSERGQWNLEITQELHNLQNGGKTQVSTSKEAFTVAKALYNVMADMLTTKQAVNPRVGKITDYYYRQSHVREKVASVPFQEWLAIIDPRAGAKSFPELTVEERVKKWKEIYDSIEQGTYGRPGEGEASGDILTRMAHERTIQFNDWKAFAEYNEKFGLGPWEAVNRAIETAARDIAVLHHLGAKPKENFHRAVSMLARKVTPQEAETIRMMKPEIDAALRTATFEIYAPAMDLEGRVIKGGLVGMQLAKNGAPVFRSLPDIANAAALTSDQWGNGYGSSVLNTIQGVLGGVFTNSAEQQKILSNLYLFSRGALAEFNAQIGGETGGLIGRLLSLQSTWSGANKWRAAGSQGIALSVVRELADRLHLSHAELTPEVKAGLGRYAVSEHEWKVWQNVDRKWDHIRDILGSDFDGKRVVTRESLDAIPDSVYAEYVLNSPKFLKKKGATIDDITPAMIKRGKIEVISTFGSMINDFADGGTTTAGMKEHHFMFGGRSINDPWGKTLRFAWQFKSAVVKTVDTMYRTQIKGDLKWGVIPTELSDWGRVSRHVLTMATLWMIGDMARDMVLNGKTPRDPTDPKYMAQALIQSGGFGIIGEAVLDEALAGGTAGDLALALAGPGFSTAANLGELAWKAGHSLLDDSVKFPGYKFGRELIGNIPLQNLMVSKAVLHNLFFNAVREELSSGFLSNLEKSTNETPGLFDENQRYFMLRPSESWMWTEEF